jgi:hypothetical protein
MTEADWIKSADPLAVVEQVGSRPDSRKRRLLLSACCRRIERFLLHESIKSFITASEHLLTSTR